MPTIDLSTPPPRTEGLLDALPRRVALTRHELDLVARSAGGAPLPFLATTPSVGTLDGRLGVSRGSAQDEALGRALGSLHPAETSLTRRGLCVDGEVDEGLVGAVGLLATPELALDLDVRVGEHHARSWHRQAGQAVATLATVDGVVFELAWFATHQWPMDLARVAVTPDDVVLRDSIVPDVVDLPYELADAAGESVRSGRPDLLAVLATQHADSVVDADGIPLGGPAAHGVLTGLATEAQGRLRVMAADVSGAETTTVGVVSWVLLADSWHALRPHTTTDGHRVQIRRVSPADLAAELAPVLAEVAA